MNPCLGHVSFPNAQSQPIHSKQPTTWAAAGPDSLVQLAGGVVTGLPDWTFAKLGAGIWVVCDSPLNLVSW
jgi:hypothetical protein